MIKNCTNTGVWQVVESDPATGAPIITYDFVNHEYLNMQTAMQMTPPINFQTILPTETDVILPLGENAISMDMMSEPERQQFLTLQKKLNKALLD